ncbi:MAG: transglutaminase domain-containing protein [Bacteroidales bacterium]
MILTHSHRFNYFLFLFILLGISLSCINFTANAYSGKIKSSIKTIGDKPTGLCFDGENLWQADSAADKIYCINRYTGKIIKEIESPAYWPGGLAWDGKYLYNADFRGRTDKSEDKDGMIYQIDPNNGNIIHTMHSPTNCPRGLTFDGKYLWTVDDSKDMVIQFSKEDGTTINSFPSPSTDPQGITFDGKYLWITDRNKDEIYMVDPSNGYVIVILDSPGPFPYGITYMHPVPCGGDPRISTRWMASPEISGDLMVVDQQTKKIYRISIRDGEKFYKKNTEIHKMTYHHNTTVYGPGKILTLDVWFALPENRVNQKLLSEPTYNIRPTNIITDRWGQRCAHYSFNNLLAGKKIELEVTSEIETSDVRYFIYPEKVGKLSEIPEDIKDEYLKDDEKYQINDFLIKKTIKEVVGNEENPYWIMRDIHQYLIGHLHYLMDGAWDTAPTVLRHGHGSCSEYSFTFMSLCKAAGIPCRYVGATGYKKDYTYMDDVFHRWVEIYLPNYGWIPTDVTHGDRESARDQAYPIGFISKKYIITTKSGGGSKTMGWTYNSNEDYTTEPKTNLNTTHYADWTLD